MPHHYLSCRPPIAGTVLSGGPVTDDLGFGPLLFKSPELIFTLAAGLADCDETFLSGRFDPQRFDDEFLTRTSGCATPRTPKTTDRT